MLNRVLKKTARRAGLRYRSPPPTIADYHTSVPGPNTLTGGRRIKGDKRLSTPDRPLVTIITAVRNRAELMAAALASIRAQSYGNVEYIVVDGASTDGTIDILRSNEDLIDLWISEPDTGIYDAFNKGVSLATGDYIGILNSDDQYEPNQIEVAVDILLETGVDWVFGDTWLHGWQGRSVRLGGDPHYAQRIRRTMPQIAQVNALAHRRVFEIFGLFRTEYRIASDYDWFLRITIGGAVGRYDGRILSHMMAGGVSTTSMRRSIREGFFICVRNGGRLRSAVPHWGLRLLYPAGVPPRTQALIDRARLSIFRRF